MMTHLRGGGEGEKGNQGGKRPKSNRFLGGGDIKNILARQKVSRTGKGRKEEGKYYGNLFEASFSCLQAKRKQSRKTIRWFEQGRGERRQEPGEDWPPGKGARVWTPGGARDSNSHGTRL